MSVFYYCFYSFNDVVNIPILVLVNLGENRFRLLKSLKGHVTLSPVSNKRVGHSSLSVVIMSSV